MVLILDVVRVTALTVRVAYLATEPLGCAPDSESQHSRGRPRVTTSTRLRVAMVLWGGEFKLERTDMILI